MFHLSFLGLVVVCCDQASRKGTPPSSRCGASMVGYRNIALLFGGVHDIEGKQVS